MKETWKDLPDYGGAYQVSNLGRVKSLKFGKERILKETVTIHGYKMVSLQLNRKPKMHTIHQLVAIVFLNHKPCGYQLVVDHIDNDKLNNNVKNLQIITHRANVSRTLRGTSVYTGVHKFRRKWRATIRDNSPKIHLGLFDTEIEAHHAYQDKLKEINKALQAINNAKS